MSLLNQIVQDFGNQILSKDNEAAKKEAKKRMTFAWPEIDIKKVITLDKPAFERITPKEGKEDKRLYTIYLIEEDGGKYIMVQGQSTMEKLFASVVNNDIAIDHNCEAFSNLSWEITTRAFKAKNDKTGKEEDRIYHDFQFLSNRNLKGKKVDPQKGIDLFVDESTVTGTETSEESKGTEIKVSF